MGSEFRKLETVGVLELLVIKIPLMSLVLVPSLFAQVSISQHFALWA